jgi:hypothetical protein
MSIEREKLSQRPVRLRRDEEELGSSASESEDLDFGHESTDASTDDNDESAENVGKSCWISITQVLQNVVWRFF